MITDATVEAGTILECARYRFDGILADSDEKSLAWVLSPTSRQRNRIVDVVPLSATPPIDREVYFITLKHNELNALSPTGRWHALCDRQIRLSLDSDDVHYLRRPKGNAVNFDPRYRVQGDDLKAIRLALVERLFPKTDIRILFRSGLSSFLAMSRARSWFKPKNKVNPRTLSRLNKPGMPKPPPLPRKIAAGRDLKSDEPNGSDVT